jgi:hypothetical protein
MWDPSSGVISGQLWGGFTLSGSGTVTVYPEVYNTANIGFNPSGGTFSYFPYPINTLSNTTLTTTVTDPTTGVTTQVVTNVVTTNTIYVEPVGLNRYNDAFYMSGNFFGYTQNNYPNQTFTASGTLVKQELLGQDTGGTNTGTTPVSVSNTPIPISVQGLRISDNYSSFSTVSNSIPYSTTTYTVTNFATF